MLKRNPSSRSQTDVDPPMPPTGDPHVTAMRRRAATLIQAVGFALGHVYRTSPATTVAALTATLLLGLAPLASVYATRLVLDAVVGVVHAGLTSTAMSVLAMAVLVQALVSTAASGVEKGHSHLSYRLGRRLTVQMTRRVLRHAARLDLRYFDDAVFYDKMQRAQRECSTRPLDLLQRVLSIARGAITLGSMSGLVIALSPWLGATMIVASLPLMVVQARFGRKNYDLHFSRTEQQRLADHLAGTLTHRAAVPEIISFRLFEFLFGRWHSAAQTFAAQDIQLHHRRSWAQAASELAMVVAYAGATLYIVYLGVRGPNPMTPGQIIMYTGAFMAGVKACQGMAGAVSSIYESALFLGNLLDFEKLQPTIEAAQGGLPAPTRIDSLELRHVSFSYPGVGLPVIRDMSLRFDRACSTLILGLNGAGKTTLMRLLLRLYDPTDGCILLNGVDLRRFNIQQLRQRMGVIFQRFLELPFSLGENIGCGDVEHHDDQARIVAAARRAHVHDFAQRLPQGYDTLLGRAFANGHELSQGQWQRLCLARLFMKNAPVLIFDEPTASVDIDTEAHLFREIHHLARDKICILVSHRALHREAADRFVVLSEGTVAEQGDFDSLIARGGEFARLWRIHTHPQPLEPAAAHA